MNPDKNDFILAIECATHVTFHYYDNIDIDIVNKEVIEELKQVVLKRFQ